MDTKDVQKTIAALGGRYPDLPEVGGYTIGSSNLSERIELSVPALRAQIAAAPDDPMRKYRAVFAEGKGVAWPKANSYNSARQIEITTVSQWIERL